MFWILKFRFCTSRRNAFHSKHYSNYSLCLTGHRYFATTAWRWFNFGFWRRHNEWIPHEARSRKNSIYGNGHPCSTIFNGGVSKYTSEIKAKRAEWNRLEQLNGYLIFILLFYYLPIFHYKHFIKVENLRKSSIGITLC